MTLSPDRPITTMNRIMIVEDDHDLLENMLRYLRHVGYDVTGCSSAAEFYRQISGAPFSLAIIDIGLPDQNGLVLAEYVRNNTDMRIIILTARAALDDKLAGLKTGADFYMLKPVDSAELALTIANLFSRLEPPQQPVPDAPVNVEPWRLDDKNWMLFTPEGRPIRLTAKEYKFVTLLSRAKLAIVPRREILDIMDYPSTGQASHALESMISRLRRKIEVEHGEFPIKTSHGEGYCLNVDIVLC